MSMMRQLWLAVVIMASVAFIGSLLISIWSAQEYLAQQLTRKNSDNANSLALSMTQMEKDPVAIDLQVAALFDTGYYQMISVVDPFGKTISERVQDKHEKSVPDWFVNLLPIASKPGMAQINDGWKQYGTVMVVSHNQFAYQALWEQAGKLLFWFCLGGGAVGLLGMLVLRVIGRSLNDVVNQAGAIGERRFIKIAEPRTPELRALASAMNGMVERIRQMFNEEAVYLEEMQHRVNHDQLTGLPNRDYFMAHLKRQLTGDDTAQCGVLAVLRLHDLNEVNDTLGRAGADELLQDLGRVFTDFSLLYENALPGRVKAGDIVVVLSGEDDPRGIAQQLGKMLTERLVVKWHELPDIYHLGVGFFERDGSLKEALSRVDFALALAEEQGANAWHAIENDMQMKAIPGEQWRTLLTHAVGANNLKLVFYPVIGLEGGVMHHEGMVRMQAEPDKPSMMAGDFMPVAAHIKLTAPIDMEVIRLAIRHLSTITDDVAVNLSAETIGNWAFRNDLSELLRSHTDICPRLWFEVPEYGAFKHFGAFRDISLILKGFGCHVGIEHFGQRLSESQKLTELGLDYIKLHSSLMHGIVGNTNHQEFLRHLCVFAHTVGIIVIAVGVQSKTELSVLKSLGVDGVTGPSIKSESDQL